MKPVLRSSRQLPRFRRRPLPPRPRLRYPRRRGSGGLQLDRHTALLASIAAAFVGGLLFVNGLLAGVLTATLAEAQGTGIIPAATRTAPVQLRAAGETTATAVTPPVPEPSQVASALAAPDPSESEPRIDLLQDGSLPAWARDGLLPRSQESRTASRRLPLFSRLSRPSASSPARGQNARTRGGGAPIQLRPDGRPQLRYLRSQERPAVPFGDLIYRAARRWSLNPAFVAAVVRVESNFDPRAQSHKGARGLMQLMPATASRFGVESDQLFSPEPNLYAGAQYLGWLTDRYRDDLDRVLAAYNAGEGAVDRYDGVPPYPETREYVRKTYAVLGLDRSTPPKRRSSTRSAG